MNRIKKYAGLLWIVLGPLAMYFLLSTARSEIIKKPEINTVIQWVVFTVVFFPIAIGLILFGLYALEGNYDHIPESSEEIDDYNTAPL